MPFQPSHPLSSPSPSAFNLSQHQGLFKWVSSLHQVAKILEFELQHQSFQWTPRTDLLYDGLVGSPCYPRDSQDSEGAYQRNSVRETKLLHLLIHRKSAKFFTLSGFLLSTIIFWCSDYLIFCCKIFYLAIAIENSQDIKNIVQKHQWRWWRNRTGRPLSPPQIHQKNI